MLNILALDQGILTGWAFTHSNRTCYGSKRFCRPKGCDGSIYHDFERWLGHKVRAVAPELIVFETPIFRGKHSVFLCGFASLIKLVAFRHDIPVLEVNISTVKKFASGKGNAKKEEMILAIKKRGYAPADDHQADSIALLLFGLKKQPRLPP